MNALIRILISFLFIGIGQAALQAQVKKFILCPGAAKSFSVEAMVGKTYQWQVLTAQSHGFVNLANGANIEGVGTNNLQITGAETNLYGSAYRCLVSDAQGLLIPDTSYIEFATTWTGTANNNWNNAANWSCGAVPDSSIDVIILTGMPVVNANAKCRSLNVKNPASIQVANGVKLDITNKKGEDAVLNSQVRIIDSLLFDLNTDTALLNQGIYEYNFTHTNPAFALNDIIVGDQANGYARKVTSISSQGQKVVLQTTQASLAEIFKDADYSLKMNAQSANVPNGLMGQKTGNTINDAESGYSFDLSGTTLYSFPGGSITITGGSIKVDGDWDIDFKYRNSKISRFKLACENLTFNADITVNVSLNEAGVIPKLSVPVDVLKKGLWFYVPIVGPIGVPVYVELALDLKATLEGRAYRETSTDINIKSNNSLSLGIKREDGKWKTINESNFSTTISAENESLTAGASIQTSLGAELSFRLYKVVGPYVELSVVSNGETNVKLANPVLWDFKTEAYLESKLGINAEIMAGPFEVELADTSVSWKSHETIFITPFEMQNLTTGNLSAKPNEYIEQPIKVAVLDNLNFPQANVSVHFKVKEGKGIVDDEVVLTDADGIAFTKWKLGPKTDTSSVIEVYATTGKEKHLVGSPIILKAVLLKGPEVTTAAVTSIGDKTAIAGGEVTNDGGSPVLARGVCWNTTGIPTLSGDKKSSGSGIGAFSTNLTNLVPNTNYYLRAYAINNIDTTYGNVVTFKTLVPVDTFNILTSHGLWKAFEGEFGDVDFIGQVNEYESETDCDLNDKITETLDSVHIQFNANGTGSLKVFLHTWGQEMNSNCEYVDFNRFDVFAKTFTWSLPTTPNTIRMIFEGGFYYEDDNPKDFTVLALSSTLLHLQTGLGIEDEPELQFRYQFK